MNNESDPANDTREPDSWDAPRKVSCTACGEMVWDDEAVLVEWDAFCDERCAAKVTP